MFTVPRLTVWTPWAWTQFDFSSSVDNLWNTASWSKLNVGGKTFIWLEAFSRKTSSRWHGAWGLEGQRLKLISSTYWKKYRAARQGLTWGLEGKWAMRTASVATSSGLLEGWLYVVHGRFTNASPARALRLVHTTPMCWTWYPCSRGGRKRLPRA